MVEMMVVRMAGWLAVMLVVKKVDPMASRLAGLLVGSKVVL